METGTGSTRGKVLSRIKPRREVMLARVLAKEAAEEDMRFWADMLSREVVTS